MKTIKLTESNSTINTNKTNFDVESSITVLADELLSLIAGGAESGGDERPDPIHIPPKTIIS